MAQSSELSLSSFKKHFDNELVCNVCLDQYNDPKTLPCHHSFCLECIQLLPMEVKVGKCYINCPTCRTKHLTPEEGVDCLPNAFKINSFLDLQKKLVVTKTALVICPKHNDPLKVYCKTCRQVICRDCTFSKEHKTHEFYLISECYPKHRQEIEASLDVVKNKMVDINTAISQLDCTEREVIKQGEQLQDEIKTHAEHVIDTIRRSQSLLSVQVQTIIRQKRQILAKQRQQAQILHSQLNDCQKIIERNIHECTKAQLLIEKQSMMDQMNTATEHVDSKVFQPIENADVKFKQAVNTTCMIHIGIITSTTFEKATLDISPCLAGKPSATTLVLRSHNFMPLPLPLARISGTLFSKAQYVKCDINNTVIPGQYKITFTPSTSQDLLIVNVGCIGIPGSPFTIPVVSTKFNAIQLPRQMRPWNIAVCDNGDIVMVIEYGTHPITVLNKEGKILRTFGTKGTKEGQFTHPRGVAITTDGHILVTDDHRLQKLTTDGICTKSVGSSNSGSGQLQFNCPAGVTVHPILGRIFVADSNNNRIQVFNQDLSFLQTIAPTNSQQLVYPFGVAVENALMYLYVAELGNHCITKLSLTTGQFVSRFGVMGHGPGQLYCPSSLVVINGVVYVSDWGNKRVSIFDRNGIHLTSFSNQLIATCFGLTKDSSGNVYIIDTVKNRILTSQLDVRFNNAT